MGCRIMERADEGILDDSVILQGHTVLFMEMSTLSVIKYKSTHHRQANINVCVM